MLRERKILWTFFFYIFYVFFFVMSTTRFDMDSGVLSFFCIHCISIAWRNSTAVSVSRVRKIAQMFEWKKWRFFQCVLSIKNGIFLKKLIKLNEFDFCSSCGKLMNSSETQNLIPFADSLLIYISTSINFLVLISQDWQFH